MKHKYIVFLLIYGLCFLGCKKTKVKANKPVEITAETTLKPVLEELITVFAYNHPNVKINISYKPQKLCNQDLANPKVDLVLGYTLLTNKEKEKHHKQNKFYFETNVLAFDALLILSNAQSAVNKISIKEIPLLLMRKTHKNQTLIMDSQTENATYEFFSHTFLHKKSFALNIQGTKNAETMLNYINKNPNKIGFTSNLSINKNYENVVFAKVENTQKNNAFVSPTKENILANQYPLMRAITFILKHNYETPATWFVSFMQQEKGQLIFKRNGAIAANMNLNIRKINYKP